MASYKFAPELLPRNGKRRTLYEVYEYGFNHGWKSAMLEVERLRREKERRELEQLDRWSDEREAEMLMQHEQHTHVNGLCD